MFFCLLFQDVFQTIIPIYKNIDEILSYAIFYLSVLLVLKKKKIIIEFTNTITIACLIFCIGLISIIRSHYQTLPIAISDALIFFKFLFIYLGSKVVFSGLNISAMSSLNIQAILYSFMLFILSIGNFIFKIFPTFDYRLFFQSQQLFFCHPTYLVSTSVIILSLLTLYLKYNKSNIIYILMISFVIFITGRFKAFAILGVYLLLFYIYIIRKQSLHLIHYILIMFIVVTITYPQLKSVFSHPDTARTALVASSIKIAADHFPFGAGFGTFGSYISSKYYSPLYLKYGISEIWGLQASNPSFITDTFWPMVIGQFGYFGLVLFIALLFYIYKSIQRITKNDVYINVSFLTCFFYLLVSSIAESSFSSYTSVCYFLLFAVYANSKFNSRPIKST